MAELTDGQAWFADARFGLFVHWGMYSAQGWEPSWPLVGGNVAFPHGQDIPVDDYFSKAGEFVPPEGAPTEWLRLAQACGMQYAVLTTKHHDGFALFGGDSATFGIEDNAPGRDLVREFVDATRAAGLRVGLYLSLPDWHDPDYPAWTDEMRPYTYGTAQDDEEAWARFRGRLLAQLRHLLTAYGRIDTLWFDGGWERSARRWGTEELEALIRELQPDIVVNDRLPGLGDYVSPEQAVPHPAPDGPWEVCMTMNNSWGPVVEDPDHKSARYLLTVLTEVAAGGGNLLLNISPEGDGSIPDWQRERLEAIAGWMDRNGEAVLGSERGLEPWQFHGPTTRKGDAVYLFCDGRPQDFVVLRGTIGATITSVRAVGTDTALTYELQLGALERILGGLAVCDVVIAVPEAALDPLLTVIEVHYRTQPPAR
jgi:alpha-L-fucosidase